jgi:glycosyltransferase involved in cell wall biosynthesis
MNDSSQSLSSQGSTRENSESISVFFPAHNEVDNIGPLTEKTVQVLESLGVDYEVLIINDGSTDGTRAVADRLGEKYDKVRPIHHEVNKGYGGAVWTGLRSAAKDLVFFTDGDGQFDITELKDFYEALNGYDAVLGYRIKRQDPFHRIVFAKCWMSLIWLLFGFRLRDLDCAFKLIRRRLLEGLEPECGGAMVTVELIVKLRARGMTYIEKGAHHYPRTAGEQSGGSPRVVLRAFKELFKTYGKLRSYRHSHEKKS